MNTDDLRMLAERADSIQGHAVARLAELDGRIRRARRRRAVGASLAAATLVAAVAVTAAQLGGPDRRPQQPLERPPSLTDTLVIPSDQTTTKADLGPGDIRGWKVLATLTNSQPEHEGAAELQATVMIHTEITYMQVYCHSADASAWYFYSVGDGGGGSGQCDQGSKSLPPFDYSPLTYSNDVASPTTLRMFVTRLSPDAMACYQAGAEDCTDRFGAPQPLAVPDAEFGFRSYDHAPAPVVMTLAGRGYEAWSVKDGEPWILDRAVQSAKDADRLVTRLPAEGGGWIVGLFHEPTDHEETCARQQGLLDYRESERARALRDRDRLCGVRFNLEVDGKFSENGGVDDASYGYGDPWVYAAAGEHVITVDVTHGDPRNARFFVMIWRAGP